MRNLLRAALTLLLLLVLTTAVSAEGSTVTAMHTECSVERDGACTVQIEFTADFAAEDGSFTEKSGWTDIFIYPGYRFKAMDALITNFHLPESTLIMLVSAFAGREKVLNAYRIAVEERYRFFSFGDAMFIR